MVRYADSNDETARGHVLKLEPVRCSIELNQPGGGIGQADPIPQRVGLTAWNAGTAIADLQEQRSVVPGGSQFDRDGASVRIGRVPDGISST